MVSSPPPTSTFAPSAASSEPPFRPISSSLYGSPASSSRASSSEIARRENFWPSLTIFRIRDSIFSMSSGWKGSGTSKS